MPYGVLLSGCLVSSVISAFTKLYAARTVPYGKSVACSTPTALEWDAKFKEMADPSGRAVMDVHQQGY